MDPSLGEAADEAGKGRERRLRGVVGHRIA
jgi:hypothetical protein